MFTFKKKEHLMSNRSWSIVSGSHASAAPRPSSRRTVLFALLLPLPSFSQAEGPRVTLSGSVVDDERNPVPNATVEIVGGVKPAKTDNEGDFHFVLSPGKYTLSCNGTTASVTVDTFSSLQRDYDKQAELERFGRAVLTTGTAVIAVLVPPPAKVGIIVTNSVVPWLV